MDALKRQVVLKKIMSQEEFEEEMQNIAFQYNRDNFFEEQKAVAILRDRMSILQVVDPYVGRYYSHKWVRKNILRQTDEDIEEMDKESQEELRDPQYQPMVDPTGEPVIGPSGATPVKKT